MTWQEICDDPRLRDLPFKLETDLWGHIVMSPASNRHSLMQGLIQGLLQAQLAEGFAFPECSIETAQGVKVADVAWASRDFFRTHGTANPYTQAPEILVEVLSPSNSLAEMEEKKELYFARGAKEVWVCAEDGVMYFFAPGRRLALSARVPGFPARVELPFD